MNKLQLIFSSSLEEIEKLVQIIDKEIGDRQDCYSCVHATNEPHYEMGKYAGEDTYCNMLCKFCNPYCEDQQCLFWKNNTEIRLSGEVGESE